MKMKKFIAASLLAGVAVTGVGAGTAFAEESVVPKVSGATQNKDNSSFQVSEKNLHEVLSKVTHVNVTAGKPDSQDELASRAKERDESREDGAKVELMASSGEGSIEVVYYINTSTPEEKRIDEMVTKLLNGNKLAEAHDDVANVARVDMVGAGIAQAPELYKDAFKKIQGESEEFISLLETFDESMARKEYDKAQDAYQKIMKEIKDDSPEMIPDDIVIVMSDGSQKSLFSLHEGVKVMNVSPGEIEEMRINPKDVESVDAKEFVDTLDANGALIEADGNFEAEKK